MQHRKKNRKKRDDLEQSPEGHSENNQANAELPLPNSPSDALDAVAANETLADPNTTTQKPPRKIPQWNIDANHGSYGFADYSGLETITLSNDRLKAGEPCPSCFDGGATGKVYPHEAGVLLRLVGQPLVTGTRYTLAGFRCHLCGEIFKPDVPAEIQDAPKYDASAVTSIAVNHYYMGLPFYRIEALQRNYGVPLADATQWDLMKTLAKMISPIFYYLQTLSANSKLLSYDDTALKILALKKGIATAVVSTYESYFICLFYTTDKCASHDVSKLLGERTIDAELITMTDASQQNQLSDVDETLFTRLIVAYCLVHGRRKFHELLEMHPIECGFVIECIAVVYRHEAHCKQQGYSALQRLHYHQAHSKPVMDALYEYLTNGWLYGGGEQNSPLGQAIAYMLKRWSGLTRFLEVAGCPLDNSICERMIKVLIRYRKNSLFYKTVVGAFCGDRLMSVIHTAVKNNVNTFDYLNALQTHQNLLAAAPQDFLPWNYQATIAKLSQRRAA